MNIKLGWARYKASCALDVQLIKQKPSVAHVLSDINHITLCKTVTFAHKISQSHRQIVGFAKNFNVPYKEPSSGKFDGRVAFWGAWMCGVNYTFFVWGWLCKGENMKYPEYNILSAFIPRYLFMEIIYRAASLEQVKCFYQNPKVALVPVCCLVGLI